MADITPTTPPTAATPATGFALPAEAGVPPAPPTVAAAAPAPLAATPAGARGNRKERIGEVISNRMAKTIIVRVERRFPHPKFKKVVTGYKKFCAHDERGEAKVGDRVRIEETRPLSKTKRWRLVAVVQQGVAVTPVAA
jgi:small subunit ribosomal protein S17